MKIKSLEPVFSDDRGVIIDLVYKTDFDAVTLITSKKGAVRGNHYHKETTQYSYILSGKIEAYSQPPGGPVEIKTLGSGDMMISVPFEKHALHAVEDSELLIITKGPRGGMDYEADTFRVEPLHLQLTTS